MTKRKRELFEDQGPYIVMNGNKQKFCKSGKKKRQISITVSQDFWDLIKQRAKDDYRTVSSYIQCVLKRELGYEDQ